MNDEQRVEQLSNHKPAFFALLKGHTASVDSEAQSMQIDFEIGTDMCHSVNVVQGGFVATMLDTTMAHTVFALEENIINVATLEIKVSYLEPSLAGKFRARGQVVKIGRSTGFLTAELFNAEGQLTATATSTVKLIRAK